jgi:hypothetical protein
MKDDQRKAMFAKMQTPQGSRQSKTTPFNTSTPYTKPLSQTARINVQMRKYWDDVLEDEAGERIEGTTPKERYESAYQAFKSEYGFKIKQVGERKAFAEWLQGLGLSVDYQNSDILERAKANGINVSTPAREQRILDQWWDFQTTHFFKNAKHYKAKLA